MLLSTAAFHGNVFGQHRSDDWFEGFPDTASFSKGCMGWLLADDTSSANKATSLPVISSPKTKLLQITGDVGYEFQYRSFVDTPYYQKNFSQHYIQANLNVVYKDNYPMRLVIRQRFNNSPYFRDIIDINARFTDQMLLTQVKQKLLQTAEAAVRQRLDSLYKKKEELRKQYADKLKQLQELQKITDKRNEYTSLLAAKEKFIEKEIRILQRGKEARGETADIETLKREVMNRFDSLLASGREAWAGDSLLEDMQHKRKENLSKLNAEKEEIEVYEKQIRQLSRSLQDSVAILKKKIQGIRNGDMLQDHLDSDSVAKSKMPRGWRTLMAIKNVGIGRSWVDYSELTVKNVSLTGAHIELNPAKLYVAAGVGRVDARFRDFVLRNDRQLPGQSVYFVRLGTGRKDKSSLIFTYYGGKRSLLNFTSDPATPGGMRAQKVMGASLEGIIRLDKNNALTLELARSSFYPNGTTETGQELKQIFSVAGRGNEAYSIKLNSYWPQTRTTISGFYKKMGEYFQSFNLQPVNTEQESYSFKVRQLVWRERLHLEAGIRKNDFSNPFINPGFQSKTVFKSFLATLRVPRYPVVTLGFYPSSQLTLLDNQVLVESQYNTWTGIVSHAYRFKETAMTTNLSYLRFDNDISDTSFIYYNAVNWSLNHFIFHRKLQLQSGVSFSGQTGLRVVTLEQSAGYQLKEWLNLQGGLKYNKVNGDATLWGGTGALIISIKKIGRLQFQYERSYLPGMNRNLLPMDMGRFGYYRSF
jgi:hypothetical protein